jgi:hypothetical protein
MLLFAIGFLACIAILTAAGYFAYRSAMAYSEQTVFLSKGDRPKAR